MNSQFLQDKKKARVRMAGFFLTLFVAVTTMTAVPAPVSAQEANQGSRNVLDTVKEGLVTGVTSGLIDAANYFVSNMAYQLALSIMGDCPGQKSCWSTKNWNQILKESSQGAAATAITSAADASGLTGMGFDVCNPALPGVNLRFQLGMLAEEKPAQPRCSFDQITTGWNSMYNNMKDAELNDVLNVSMQPGQSPMSFGLSAFTYKYTKKEEDTRTKYEDWATNKIGAQGFNDVRDPVSGRTMTPGSLVAEQMKNAEKKKTEGKAENTKQYSQSAIAAQAVVGIAVTGVRVFVQTLTARMWNKLVTGLLSAEEAVSQDPDIIFNPDAMINPGLAEVSTAIEAQYATVKTRDVGEYDIISEFATCDAKVRTQNNCVMDSQLAAAVRMGDAEGLTLAEAFRRGLIADKPLISEKNDPENNRRSDCYRDGYCESNLKKMRAARIVPIGWEMAANLSPKKKPVSLKQAMEMFDQCGTGPKDEAYPFCHLVDPNWVLKVPPLQCRAMGYGSTPLDPQLPTRTETCVDMQSCLKQGDNGACEDQWGYCTKEEHVWRFKAEKCPSYFNSCRSMKRTTDSQPVNYLLNTMERGVCNAGNAGCKEYSVERTAVRCQLNGGECTAANGCLCKNGSADCTCSNVPTAANLSCSVQPGAGSCTTPSGKTCQLNGGLCPASSGTCACQIDYACRVEKGSSVCFTTSGDTATDVDNWQGSPARFLTRAAEKCDVSNDGCTKLQKIDNGQSLNLIRNGGFEELDDQAGDGTLNHARYWWPMAKMNPEQSSAITSDVKKVVSGSYAAHASGINHYAKEELNNGSACDKQEGCPMAGATGKCLVPFGLKSCTVSNSLIQYGITVEPGKIYTLSANVKPGSSAGGFVTLKFYKGDGSDYPLAANDVVTSAALYVADDGVNFRNNTTSPLFCKMENTNLALRWEADVQAVPTCTFSLREGLPVRYVSVSLDSAWSNTDLYFDDVMLEEGNGTLFHEGSNGGDYVYGNVPPANLGCRGEDTDPAACASYAAMCRENEVGCERFTPADGGASLTGVATAGDLCPAECVGYDAFKEQASTFSGEKFPVYFIPSTAQVCPSEAVGCSAFTNLRTETASYFTKLRSCAMSNDPDQDVFYTWEGSDLTGYQLKTWHFKTTREPVQTDTCCADGECVPGACAPGNKPSGVAATNWPAKYKADLSVQGDSLEVSAGRAPCTSLGGNEMTTCESRDGMNANGSLLGYCTRADVDAGDIDCREFYDRDGNRHYRRLNNLVEISASCDLYRMTDTLKADCRLSGGNWDDAGKACLYRFDAATSTSCNEEHAGCRAFKGGVSGDVRLLLDDDLETTAGFWSNGATSTEALFVGGHSLKVAPNVPTTRQLGTTVQAGLSYTLTLWARGEGTVTAALKRGSSINCNLATACDAGTSCLCTDAASGLSCVVDATAGAASTCAINGTGSTPASGFVMATAPLKTTSEWRQYTLGPVLIPSQAMFGQDPMALEVTFGGSASAYFIDNVQLRENRSDFYAIDGSWRTPTSCDSTLDGAVSPQEMIGCREYSNSKAQSAYLRSLSKLCREGAVGCAAYLNTQNSTTPYPSTYNAVCKLETVCTAAMANGRPNCPCSYASSTATVADACRVNIGESSCRFNLDAVDLGKDGKINAHDYPDRVTVPADSLMYLVLGSGTSKSCNEKTAGCRAVAERMTAYEQQCNLPAVTPYTKTCELHDPISDRLLGSCTVRAGESGCVASVDSAITVGWSEKGIIDNPEKYGKTLCRQEALRCEEYAAGGSLMYFKDPGTQVCEYAEGVVIDGEQRSGFFRRGASGKPVPCAPELLTGEKSYTMYRNADQTCRLPKNNTTGTKKTVNVGGPGCGVSRPCAVEVYEDYVQDGVCRDTVDGTCPCTAPDSAGKEQHVCFVSDGMTTCGYQGWVGQCTASNDQCEEYVDRLATSAANREGKPYYYRANTLDLASCKGQASLVGGCVLLDQTSNVTKSYSSPYTYLLSQRQKGGGQVTPGSCQGNNSNECAQRCVSLISGFCACDPAKDPGCKDTQDNLSCRQDSDCTFQVKDNNGNVTETLNYGHCEGDFKYGLSCGSNGDCNQTAGERCLANGAAFSNSFSSKRVNFPQGDDTNIVVKARLDRECSEWLSCESESPTWDETAGKFKSVCTGFQTCTKNVDGGQPGQCAEVVKEDHKRYSRAVYAARDTGWYGNDASGYTIPETYPMSYVLPVNVVPKGCVAASDTTLAIMGSGGHVKTCKDTASCGDSTQICMTFEGMCRKGDKINTQAPCRRDNDCKLEDGEICSRSYLATRRFGVVFEPNRTCKSDDDCRAGYYSSDDNGACVDDRCVWRYQTGSFQAEDTSSVGACRAYPESDAPFGDTTLVSGTSAANDTFSIEDGYDVFGKPAAMKPDWASANVCNKANDCECDYLRVKYGSNTERFYTYPGNSSGPVVYNGMAVAKDQKDAQSAGQAYANVFEYPGICVGGPYEGLRCKPNQPGLCSGDKGRSCTKDLDCQYAEGGVQKDVGPCESVCGRADEGGKCTVWSNVSYQRGWSGFCVDQDRSFNVNGSESQFACNLWLPIAQLNGSPDMANQYREAGFNPSRSKLAYCTVAEGNVKGGGGYAPVLYKEEEGTNALFQVRVGKIDGTAAQNEVYGPADISWDGDSPSSTISTEDQQWLDSQSDAVKEMFGGSHVALPFSAYDLPAERYEDMGLNKGNIAAFYVKLDDKHSFYLWPGNNWQASAGNNSGDSSDYKSDFIDDWTGEPNGVNCMDGGRAYSDGGCDSWDAWCLGIKADFTSSGVFRRFKTNTCSNETGVHGKHVTEIKALLRESCEEIYVAHDQASFDFPSMAQTDNLYKSRRLNGNTERPNTNLSREDLSLSPAGAVAPFDEFSDDGNKTYKINISNLLPVWSSEGGSSYSLAGPKNGDVKTTSWAYPKLKNKNENSFAVAGQPFAAVGEVAGNDVKDNRGSFDSAKTAGLEEFKKLFIKTWRGYEKEMDRNFTRDYGTANLGKAFDAREKDKLVSVTNAPRVAAVNVNNCSASVDGLCGESTPSNSTFGGLTVNDVTDRDVADNLGSYKATIKFYAMADKNHMPLRRVIFDYGDGSPVAPNEGWFKNHRGCREDAAVCGDDSRICGSNGDFDKLPQACDDRFFSYVHTYRCTGSKLAELPECAADGEDQYYPCKIATRNQCVFKPRVQVMDNWGLCNGSCPGGPGGFDAVCMNRGADAIGTLTFKDGITGFNPSAPDFSTNECVGMVQKVVKDGLSSSLYTYTYKGLKYSPWTEFGGKIIVTAQ
jgi:hypothetical protein